MGRRRWRAAPLVGVVVVLAAVAAACTGGHKTVPPSSTTAPVVEGGTLRLGITGAMEVDPTKASLASPTELMLLGLLHARLTIVGDDGVAQPALATSWEANDARTAFRFTVDPAATFTSGRAVTPQDVIASLERVMAAGDASLPALSLEAVTGFGPFSRGETDHVEGLTAPDAHTVRFGLDRPLSVLPEVLSNPVLGIVDVESVAGDDVRALDLSGAWTVVSADAGTVRLDRRPEAPGHLDAVEVHSFDAADAAYEAFDAGTVDWASVPTDRYDQARRDHGEAAFAPFHAELFFGMNVRAESLSDPAFRSAIAAAIDRDAVVAAVYPDLADPLSSLVPSGVAGSDPKACADCGYDGTVAKAKLREAFPDGKVPTVQLDYDKSTAQQAMAELVAEQLDAVGIPTKLRPKPRDEYETFVVSGSQELFSFGWIGAYGSPDAYLAPLFGSTANDNLTGFRSPIVDGLLERARSGTDSSKNAERWAIAETKILEAAVVVPIAQFRTQVVVAERVHGFVHAADGTVDWAAVSVTG